MRGLLTTRDQHCWKELIEKEAFSRVSWKVKYGHKFPRLEPCSGPRRKCILPAICPLKEQEERLSPPRTQEEGTGFKKQGEGISLPRKQEDKDQEPLLKEMRPATPKTKHLLYQGISREGQGRHLYLQERKLKNPEEKFHYPVLSSWEYGWRLGDVITEIKAPIHARSGIVKDTFYIRNGVFHHPSKSDKLS
ncbi:protein ATP6V1FNB [Mauremys reevesii]|uniref:protein ATP6V1FNB n=1 Tax=Mauremys reevesii TaxID=260615 RepID=UPI0019400CAD|nr:protein ATP6V1FNB [Mauremys reevesii]